MNCWVPPEAMLTVEGLTAIETSVALATVPATLAVTLPRAALTVKLPAPTACSMPALLMVATEAGVAVQVTWLVTSPVVPSP